MWREKGVCEGEEGEGSGKGDGSGRGCGGRREWVRVRRERGVGGDGSG